MTWICLHLERGAPDQLARTRWAPVRTMSFNRANSLPFDVTEFSNLAPAVPNGCGPLGPVDRYLHIFSPHVAKSPNVLGLCGSHDEVIRLVGKSVALNPSGHEVA